MESVVYWICQFTIEFTDILMNFRSLFFRLIKFLLKVKMFIKIFFLLFFLDFCNVIAAYPTNDREQPPMRGDQQTIIGNFLPAAEREQLRQQMRGGEAIIKEVIPLEAREFYENLTVQDRHVLEKVLSKAPSYTSMKEVLTDLRNGSSTLYDKAVQLFLGVRQSVAQLSPPARAFVDESVAQIQGILGEQFSLGMLKTQAAQIVQRYRALEASAKNELDAAFPMVAAVVHNPIVQTIATGLLGIESAASAPAAGDGEGVAEEENIVKKIVT